MKVLVVLALAVFTGCNANILYADAPKPQLEELTDAFWGYVSKATQTADDTIQMIKNSPLGQQLNDAATMYTQRYRDQAQEIISTITMETSDLREQMKQEISEKLMPLTEDMKVKFQEQVEKLKQEMAAYGDSLDSMDSDALREILMQKTEELRVELEQNRKDLQVQVGSIFENIRQHLQALKERMVPLTEQVQTELTQKATHMRDSAAPYVGEIREKIGTKELENRLSALYNALFRTK